MKKKIIIWGGNKRELTLDNLDSHASVSAYFLTKYLDRYYEIVNLVDIDSPEEILHYDDIHAVISSFQKGFTNRLILKRKEDLFMSIRNHVKGKLCSVCDYNDVGRYYEDIIFTVREPDARNIGKIREQSHNPNIIIRRMGWCADPDICRPIETPSDEINVFVDHHPYNPKAPDCTLFYYHAFRKISEMNLGITLNVFQQNNEGIIKWSFEGSEAPDSGPYVRANKVPWLELIERYKKMHIFCLTHPESAGLSAIEAAMCGARLYIPKYRLNRLFISEDLLSRGIEYRYFRRSAGQIMKTLAKDIEEGFDREANHRRLKETNSWQRAAEHIHRGLRESV